MSQLDLMTVDGVIGSPEPQGDSQGPAGVCMWQALSQRDLWVVESFLLIKLLNIILR